MKKGRRNGTIVQKLQIIQEADQFKRTEVLCKNNLSPLTSFLTSHQLHQKNHSPRTDLKVLKPPRYYNLGCFEIWEVVTNDDVGKMLGSGHAGGRTMTYPDYLIALEGNDPDNFEKNWKFNPATGEYDKTNEWDATTIKLDESSLETHAQIIDMMNGISVEDAMDIVLNEIGIAEPRKRRHGKEAHDVGDRAAEEIKTEKKKKKK